MEIHTIGIDIGKTVFNLVGLSVQGEVVVRKKFSRKQLLHFTANLRVGLIGMEACGGSHFLGPALREQGHEVRLIPAQYVKPFVKTNKNDYIDAEAIAEAVGRPRMRFVPIKTDEQLDMQSLHRVAEFNSREPSGLSMQSSGSVRTLTATGPSAHLACLKIRHEIRHGNRNSIPVRIMSPTMMPRSRCCATRQLTCSCYRRQNLGNSQQSGNAQRNARSRSNFLLLIALCRQMHFLEKFSVSRIVVQIFE
jgi:hypothetical protein